MKMESGDQARPKFTHFRGNQAKQMYDDFDGFRF